MIKPLVEEHFKMFARRSTSLISTLSRSSFPLPRPQHVSFSTLGPKQATSFNFAPKSHMKHVILCGTLLAMGYATQRYCETEQKQDKPIIGGNKFHFNHGAAVYPHPDKEYKGTNNNVVYYKTMNNKFCRW